MHQLFEKITALLKEEGFGHLLTETTTHTATLTVTKERTRVVLHMSDGVLPIRQVAALAVFPEESERLPSDAVVPVIQIERKE